MNKNAPQCVKCKTLNCKTGENKYKYRSSCPTRNYPELIKESIKKNKQKENLDINLAWRKLMDKIKAPDCPMEQYSWTRVDEIIEYAKIRGMKRLGIAFCIALKLEAGLLNDILEKNGFDVVSVCCLCGELKPKDVSITEGNQEETFCNPIMQAEVLNREHTELNILIGLCLGHDILFLKNARAETTPLVVKDRATGHNPTVALYLSQGYFKKRFIKK